MPATTASPWRNSAASASSAGGTKENVSDEHGQVGAGVHPHQDEVVALRDDVLVHLLRPLRRDEQDEAELAPLAGDADGVLGGERGERVLGPAGQMLCASSITISTGSRAARRRQSAREDASAATACSSRVSSDPRSTTTHRGPPGCTSSSSDPLSAPDQTCQRSTPRFRARRASERSAVGLSSA